MSKDRYFVMEKNNKIISKKSIILLIITIVTILGVVGLSAYAYFATTISNSANIAANVKTIGGAYSFTVKTSGDINMNVNLNDMLESKASSTAIKSDNANVVVNLQSPSNNETTLCEYDIVWNWGDTSDVYSAKDSGAPAKEFTVNLLKNSQTVVSEADLTSFLRNDKKVTLYHGSTISSSLAGVEDTYKIESKIYNLSIDQPNIKGKNFTGKITVENVDCSIDSLWGRYVPVEYIGLTGTQYINPQYIVTANTMIKTKFSSSNISNMVIYGNSSGATDGSRLFALDTLLYAAFGASRGENPNNLVANTIYETVHSTAGLYINNVQYQTSIGNSFYQLLLFKDMYSTSYTFKGNVYYVKLYDNNKLVRDLVPVKDILTNKYGMFDRVTNQFFGNSGTGDFTGGNEIKRVDYLESTGTQRFIVPTPNFTSNSNFKVKYYVKNSISASSQIFGNYNNVSLFAYASSKYDNLWVKGVTYPNGNLPIDRWRLVEANGTNIDFNYTRKTFTRPSTPIEISEIGVLASQSAAYVCPSGVRISYLQIENSIDLIPVKMNGVGYMLDTIEWKLYANAGSGSFVLGPEF